MSVTAAVAAALRQHHSSSAMAWEQARTLAQRLPAPLGTQDVPLDQAAGRTLGQPLTAAAMLPGFDNAAMDGYAVCGPGPWHVIGCTLAGTRAAGPLTPGEAVEIATGAPVPAGTDRVVQYEIVSRTGSLITAPDGDRCHIRRAGEYIDAGQQLLPAGSILTAAALGLAASAGIDAVTVRTQPSVRVLVTGDEIVTAGIPSHGRVRDAIGPVITALLKAWDVASPQLRWLPDRPADALTAAVAGSLSDVDVTIVCGSSSVGPADGLHDTLHTTGATVHVDGVACRPGHPQLLASAGQHWLVGVPGNPFAALVAAYTLVQPLLAGLAGRTLPEPPEVQFRGKALPAPGVTRLLPVQWRQGEAHLIHGARPGYLGPAAQADALAVLPPTWQPGETVQLLMMPL
ncbi:molybdopterin molybdotransferase MoeA [Dactylosporangium sp. NPDC005555]|uniref:molybdopterin molybdotransferase MoeA n=1 Tax=Dactylosporangium sp. NPDC005555 TaxID=3154889 RepID=UPI0033AECDC6